MYLGAELSKMTNVDGKECWDISSDKYCTSAVTNVESVLENCGLRLPPKCVTPISCGYCLEMDLTGELEAYGVKCYQNLIKTLRWAVEIGWMEILLGVSLLSTYLAPPREGHL